MPSGGGGNTTTTQEFKPPAYTQSELTPWWQDYVSTGAQLAQQIPQTYNGMTVAPMNSATSGGLAMMADQSVNGSPDVNAARGQLMDTSNGAYLNSNPYASNPWTQQVISNNASNMANAFRVGTSAQNDASANMQGAFGGSGWMQKQALDAAGLARSVGQMSDQTQQNQTNLAAQMYQGERGNQMQAAGLAPQFSTLDTTAAKNLTGVGDAYNAYTQKLLDAQKSAWDTQQQAPWTALDQFGNVLSRASGTGSSNTSTINPGEVSAIGQGLGLLGTGYAASQFFR